MSDPLPSVVQAMSALRAATLNARARTGDATISTHCESGKVRVIRAVPTGKRGRFDIIPLGPWVDIQSAISRLEGMR